MKMHFETENDRVNFMLFLAAFGGFLFGILASIVVCFIWYSLA